MPNVDTGGCFAFDVFMPLKANMVYEGPRRFGLYTDCLLGHARRSKIPEMESKVARRALGG